MKDFVPKKIVYVVCEGDWDILFIQKIWDIFNFEDNVLLKLHPRGDMESGKPKIIKNLNILKSQYGYDEDIKYFGIYDSDNSDNDLEESNWYKLLKIDKCLEFLLLNILDDEYFNKHKDNINLTSIDIKNYFLEKYNLKTKEDFRKFLDTNITKNLLENKKSELEIILLIINSVN